MPTSDQPTLDLLDRCRDIPHAWVTGDDEFGRASEFRAELRRRGERYIVDVPCNTLVRHISFCPNFSGELENQKQI